MHGNDAAASSAALPPSPQPPLVQLQRCDATRAELLGVVVEWLLTNGLTASAQLLHEEATGQMREAYYHRKALRNLHRAVEEGSWDAAHRFLRKVQQANVPFATTSTAMPLFVAPTRDATMLPPPSSAREALQTGLTPHERPVDASPANALASLSFMLLEQQLLELVGEGDGQRAFSFFMHNVKPLEGAVSAQHIQKLAYVLTCRRVADAADVYTEYRNWTCETGRTRLLAVVRGMEAAATTTTQLSQYCHLAHLCDANCNPQLPSAMSGSNGTCACSSASPRRPARPTLDALVDEALSYRLLRRACGSVAQRMQRVCLTSLLRPVHAQLPPLRPVCRVHLAVALSQSSYASYGSVHPRVTHTAQPPQQQQQPPHPQQQRRRWCPPTMAAASASDRECGSLAGVSARADTSMTESVRKTWCEGATGGASDDVVGSARTHVHAHRDHVEPAAARLLACELLYDGSDSLCLAQGDDDGDDKNDDAAASDDDDERSGRAYRQPRCDAHPTRPDDSGLRRDNRKRRTLVALAVATMTGAVWYLDVDTSAEGVNGDDDDDDDDAVRDGQRTRQVRDTTTRASLLHQHTFVVRGLRRHGHWLLCYGGLQAVLLDVSGAITHAARGRAGDAPLSIATCTLTHGSDVYAGCLLACGSIVATGLSSSAVTFWDAASRLKCSEGTYGSAPIVALVANHTSTVCYAASRDGPVRAIDVATGLILHTMAPSLPVELCSVALSPSSTLLLVAFQAMPIHIWDVVTGTLLPVRLTQASEAAHTLLPMAWVQGDNYVLVGANNGDAVCYNVSPSALTQARTHSAASHGWAAQQAHAGHMCRHNANDTLVCACATRDAATLQAHVPYVYSTGQHNVNASDVVTLFRSGRIVDVQSSKSITIWASDNGELVVCKA